MATNRLGAAFPATTSCRSDLRASTSSRTSFGVCGWDRRRRARQPDKLQHVYIQNAQRRYPRSSVSCDCYPKVESSKAEVNNVQAAVDEKDRVSKLADSVPLPLTAREMVLQTAQSMIETESRGKKLQVVEWLLPVNQRRLDFLITDPTAVQPTSFFEEFRVASTLASVLLEGTEEREITSSRLDDGIDSEPVGLLTTDDNQYMAVVFPTADVIDNIRELAQRNRESTIILVNPQWTMQGNIVSDFGFGTRRKRAEEFLSRFETSYSLVERRIGNNIGPNFVNGVRGVVRMLKASRGDWQIHVMSTNIGILRMPAVTRKTYPSYGELCSLLTAYEMRRRGLTMDQLKESLKEKVEKKKASRKSKTSQDKREEQATQSYIFFADDEIENMDKRMLTAALISYGIRIYRKGTKGKSEDLSIEEMREALYERQKVQKANLSRKVKKNKECRVCGGSGLRQCPLCVNKGQKYGRYVVDLSCSVCGGHQYVICPACRGKNLSS